MRPDGISSPPALGTKYSKARVRCSASAQACRTAYRARTVAEAPLLLLQCARRFVARAIRIRRTSEAPGCGSDRAMRPARAILPHVGRLPPVVVRRLHCDAYPRACGVGWIGMLERRASASRHSRPALCPTPTTFALCGRTRRPFVCSAREVLLLNGTGRRCVQPCEPQWVAWYIGSGGRSTLSRRT